MKEPPRQSKIDLLKEPFRGRVKALLVRLTNRGFDPVLFETLRSQERQQWLYGVGRTHSLKRKPVTWTLRSVHLTGNAADIISKSRLWDFPQFYEALREEALKLDLHVLAVERCHVQASK